MLFDFVGPSYVYRSVNFDCQRTINMYPARTESGTSKGKYVLCNTPGRSLFATVAAQPIRGMLTTDGRAFIVAYNVVYELFSDGTSTSRGTIGTYSGNVSMAASGTEVIIVDGTATGGWILTLATNVLTQITSLGFLGGVTVCYLDGYFITNVPNTGQYIWSDLNDGLTWDAANVANAEGSPDNLVALVATHLQVFLIGSTTTEVIYDTGASPDPFARVQGVFMQYGTNSPFSVQQVANTIFWIGSDQSGANVVWMAEGYQPRKISTSAIEFYLSKYDATDATSYSYQEDGHFFVEWSIPSMPTSLVYDIGQDAWHERSRWNTSSGIYERDRANFHLYVFGKHLVSDFENGKVYEQSLTYQMDDDVLMRRTRVLPYFVDDLEFLYFSKFQVDMQTGVGLATDSNSENMNPHMTLRWSDDGGHTWSTELAVPIGKIGEYNTRAIWRRLGRSRARVFEVSVVANVPVYLIAAHLDASKGYA